jgi:hypothetical protein
MHGKTPALYVLPKFLPSTNVITHLYLSYVCFHPQGLALITFNQCAAQVQISESLASTSEAWRYGICECFGKLEFQDRISGSCCHAPCYISVALQK